MPSRKFHNLLNKIILGKEYDFINRLIDFPYFLNPKRHREIFGHNIELTPLLFYLVYKDVDVALATILHIIADKYIDKEKEKKLLLLLHLVSSK